MTPYFFQCFTSHASEGPQCPSNWEEQRGKGPLLHVTSLLKLFKKLQLIFLYMKLRAPIWENTPCNKTSA